MQKRKLGGSGLEISPLVLGGNVFGWTADEPTSFKILDAFVDAGFNAIDTADMYSRWAPGHHGGESETIIGKWMKLRGNRAKVLIFTKVGLDMGEGKKGLSRPYILRAVEDSLRRLQTDTIDLYQSHTDDADTPLEQTLGTYGKLIEQGKVRAIGASNYKAARLAKALEVSKAHGLPSYQSLQPHYNLIERADFEGGLAPLCLEKGLGVIPYFPLAAGFLTGKYRSERDLAGAARGPMVKKYLNDRGFRILRALDQAAKQCGATPAQVALAWLLAQPSVTAPIVSATKLEQLRDSIHSTQITLDAGSIELLNQAGS